MRELFVYYRIREGAAQDARTAVLAMHDALRASHPGLTVRLLTRREDDGTATWMEAYAMAPSGIDTALESDIALRALRLASFIDGPRHVEAFDVDEEH
ncbi:MAG: DUF4936 family protein [Pseudomonadota bacterium]|nr:DUF4936 family protein [Pseudomonadota bacterium]